MNLGSLYLPVRAVDESPVFAQGPSKSHLVDETPGRLHLALVKIRDPQNADDTTLRRVGLTLVQLLHLGMASTVVVDCEDGNGTSKAIQRRLSLEQADRIVSAIEKHGNRGARRLDNIITASAQNEELQPSVKIRRWTGTSNRELLLAPLRRGVIPVVASVAFVPETYSLMTVDANEVVLALARELTGLNPGLKATEYPRETGKVASVQKQVSIDRIILLDPLGGIPSADQSRGSHVFINLEQEYGNIKREIMQNAPMDTQHYELRRFSRLRIPQFEAQTHLGNLELLQQTLALLPPSSSALLTTLQDAANSNRRPQELSQSPGVGTRRQRNPLIYNLLTDKPVFSSSLPSERTSSASSRLEPVAATTFVKRGMPVTIIPNPLDRPWTPPLSSNPPIQLSDPRIDLPRLIHLIEDSFGRKLDINHYFSRIKDRLAGIIIVGEYEGGALLTWETPDGSPTMVPYLDKFAVLKRSQGAGGVADIIFKAMVRDCFPQGVCWRSRRDNPVNKWYFERAKGTWKIPETNWTMFWTTGGVEGGQKRRGVFGDYEAVCKGVVPSWADNKKVVD